MKFEISVPDLQYAMRLVKDIVPAAGPLAESVGVLITAKGNHAVFTTFNPEIIAKATVNIKSIEDGEAVIDASSLHNAITRFQPRNEKGVGTSDIVVRTSTKTRKLTISATTRYASGAETPHKRVFALRNQEFFPAVPSSKSAISTLTVPADKLMDGIDSVAYAASSDKGQLIFTGMSLKIADNTMVLAATDGVCLAEYTVDVEYNDRPVELVLPGSFAFKVAKSFFDHDLLELSLTPSMLFIKTPNLILGGALIKDSYPDYKSLIPPPDNFCSVDKHVLLDNLLNLSYEASNVSDNRASVIFEGGTATLVCGDSDNGGLETDFKGAFKFDCDLKLFAASVKNIVGADLLVGFSTPEAPIQLGSKEESSTGASLLCILVPLSPV